jgi:hypothetical protein
VLTPSLDAAPYLPRNTITVEQLTDTVADALRDERFKITTHPETLAKFQQKAADYEGYIAQLNVMRKKALG